MKRFLTHLALAVTALMTLMSCNEAKRKKALLPNISGKAGEVVIVIDKGAWEGVVGSTLRDTLAADCPFLPQKERGFVPLRNQRNSSQFSIKSSATWRKAPIQQTRLPLVT